MPYFVKRGEVHNGPHVYAMGEPVPDKVVDEAMIEAGAVEWRDDAPSVPASPYAGLTRKELFAICKVRELEVSKYAKLDELAAILEADDAPDEPVAGDEGEGDDEATEGGE